MIDIKQINCDYRKILSIEDVFAMKPNNHSFISQRLHRLSDLQKQSHEPQPQRSSNSHMWEPTTHPYYSLKDILNKTQNSG